MASSESTLYSSPLKASAVEIIDLASDDDSVDSALHSHFDRDLDVSNGLETIDSDDDADDDDEWSIYEEVFDVLESNDIVPGCKCPSTPSIVCFLGRVSV
jgi:hypothetical protein